MTGYAVARLSEIEETETDVPFRAIRQHFGIMSFGVSASTPRADGDVVKEHTESHPDAGDELYVVLTGRARFQLDGAAHDAPAGTLVHVAPAVTRSAVALEAGTTLLSFGAGAPGTPYVPNGWDVFAPLFGLFESGEAGFAELVGEAPPAG